MRTLKQAVRFKRDLRREAKGPHRQVLQREFTQIVEALARDRPLAARYKNHALVGNWQGCKECHIRPDLLLIYEKPDAHTLRLVRLGSHAALFA